MSLRYLSLFSGIGAFEKALSRIGIEYELVGFSEIDKYAIKSYCAVHKVNESLNLGDISKIDLDKLPNNIDLITHGSPCQDFSIAGKLAGGDKGSGTRSSLMWCTVDIVEKACPKYVVWENVKNVLSIKNKHNFDDYIRIMDEMGYNSYYQVLNAKDYGIPQNRERIFTVSIRKDVDTGIFKFPEKEKLRLRLKDMLEKDVDEKYYLSDEKIEKIKSSTFAQERLRIQEKDYCDTILARDWKDPKCIQVGELDIKGHDCVKRVYSGEGIAPTLTDMQGGNRQPKIITVGNYMPSKHDASRIVDEEGIAPTVKENHGTVTAVAMRGRYNESGKVEQQIEISSREIANSITTVQKDSMIGEPQVLRYERTEFGKAVRKKYENGEIQLKRDEMRVLAPRKDGISNTITTVQKDNYIAEPCLKAKEDDELITRIRVRKLTPRECWRLMGFDDKDFDKAKAVPTSNTQLYKQAGNSIVVNVLEAIFKCLFLSGGE